MGVPAPPASPVMVAGYLASLAEKLRRAGKLWEPGHPALRATLRGILAAHGKSARPAAALTSTEIKKMLASGGTDCAMEAWLQRSRID